MLLDTYRTFGCETGEPTFRYSLIDGVKDGYLVNPVVVDARTEITTQLLSDEGYSIAAVAAPEDEKTSEEIIEETFKVRDFERKFFSEETNRILCRTFLDHALKDPITGEIGKTIAFCVSQHHAAKITQILNELAHELFPGKYNSDFAMQVTSNVANSQQATTNFTNNNLGGTGNFDERYKTGKTRVCVTVGMMTTGYDCPDILNLCMMRPIFSPTDFVQIKGRGTRKHNFTSNVIDRELKEELGELQKEHFKLFDFFANCEYFEEKFNYDEVLKLPKPGEPRPEAPPQPPAVPIADYENFNPDPLKTLEEMAVGPDGMKIDRRLFERFEERVKSDDEIKRMVEGRDFDAIESYIVLTWKYRQIETGGWNLFQAQPLTDEHRSDRLFPQNPAQQPATDLKSAPSCDTPLPWDHIDTGIDKQWLKADLQRALEAATVPDCSFDGCSHCGVCGADFGHNIVVPPQPIPTFTGHFVPNQNRAQRLRLWFGKQADMALISHLDLMRLLDRAVRRAAIPVAFTGGFHPGPRIVPASALPLGTTSSGEIVDFDLTEPMEPEAFKQKLAAQLPESIPLYRVESIAVNSASATQLLEQAEYVLAIQCLGSSETRSETEPTPATWQFWIEQILASSQILVEHTTKSGKVQQINLRERLSELELLAPEQMPQAMKDSAILPWVGVRYVGSCRNDGALLRPEHIIQMLEFVAQQEFQLGQIHRQHLFLASLHEWTNARDKPLGLPVTSAAK
ncbi:TIGR03936 family radical SAM-associated protein [Leptolyngbya sp. 7M]|uniref:TIGR03936 family radical SAM-associated protein n=1 Tax=Leptolyngbya sp. 7M TaxID=2812896 RepID=UPI0021F10649|nr:TIGR03936 family radical SAM-associated protein [Leptolyngbya sp. 7M]